MFKKLPNMNDSTDMLAHLIKKSGAPLPDFVKETLINNGAMTTQEVTDAEDKAKGKK